MHSFTFCLSWNFPPGANASSVVGASAMPQWWIIQRQGTLSCLKCAAFVCLPFVRGTAECSRTVFPTFFLVLLLSFFSPSFFVAVWYMLNTGTPPVKGGWLPRACRWLAASASSLPGALQPRVKGWRPAGALCQVCHPEPAVPRCCLPLVSKVQLPAAWQQKTQLNPSGPPAVCTLEVCIWCLHDSQLNWFGGFGWLIAFLMGEGTNAILCAQFNIECR